MKQSIAIRCKIVCSFILPLVASCSTDIFDVKVELMAQPVHADFGSSSGTIPTIVCGAQSGAQTPTMCGPSQAISLTDDAGEVNVAPGCDAATSRCFVQATALVRYTVDVLKDESFTNQVARKTVSVVRMLDIKYKVPKNTTTFDIPRIDVSVGPPGSRTATDPGVHLVDKVDVLPAGTVVVGEPRHLTVADGSPARDLIEASIKAKSPFVFILNMTVRLESGVPVPAGMVDLEIQPLLGLGLR